MSKKEPLIYNDQVVGYIEDIIYQEDIIKEVQIFLFYSNLFEEIVNKINNSDISKLGETKFSFDIKDDILTLKNTEL